MVNPPVLVHRPEPVYEELGPLTPSQCSVHVHQVLRRVADEGKITIFFPVVLPSMVSSPASPSSGVGVQLRWAKSWPCHGGCPGKVNVVVGCSTRF